MNQSAFRSFRWLFFCILVFLCFISIFYFFRPAQDHTLEAGDTPDALVYYIVHTYQENPDLDTVQLEALFRALARINETTAEKWQSILEYWHFANNTFSQNYDVLPDGISDPSRLCIIVLGYALNSDGSMQPELIGRLATALASFHKYPEAHILCTGGGTASQNPNATEADSMAMWLMEHGVPSERLIVENRSLSTAMNARYSYEILRTRFPELTSVAIVTSDYHIPWGAVLFQTQFLLGDAPLTVVSNAAFRTDTILRTRDLLHWQMIGILEIMEGMY